MVKRFVKFSWLFLIGLLPLISACTKETTSTNDAVTNYVEDAVLELRDSTNVGPEHCYELVFPITIQFPDSMTTQVDSFGQLKTALRDWKEANPDNNERPTLVYPISIINQDGEVVTVANAEELKALRDACPFPGFEHGGHHGSHGPRGGHGGGSGHSGGSGNGGCMCFQLVFPISIAFPDDTTQEVADQRAFHDAVKAWHMANPDIGGRPELVFPLTVKLADGTTQQVADAAALRALKESCAGGN